MDNDIYQRSDISIEVLNTVDAVILVMDKDGRIVLFNRASESLTGFTFEDVKNKCPWDLFIPHNEHDGVKNVFSELAAGNYPGKHRNHWLTKDNKKRLIDWSNSAITDKNGDISFVIATGIDVTDKEAAENEINNHVRDLEETILKRTSELMKANSELMDLVHVDGLTNILNRRSFDEVIEKEIERGKRSNKPLSLLLCDLDCFKKYNDTYGHVKGDNCLKKVATTLNNFFSRAADFVARYGGEEFVVILPGIESQRALELANNLTIEIRNCELPHESSPVSNVVTMSIGLVTRLPGELTNSTSLIDEADKALYQAKQNGRDQVQSYSGESEARD